ncbi:MAG: DUF433 domain-containing protein [Nostoc sp. S4]|nr:DUF433 domain-containing protein [Nostoc sp. S4]
MRNIEKLDRITLNPNVCLGQRTIWSMRITVSVILKMLANSKSVAEILETLSGIKILRLRFFEKIHTYLVTPQWGNPEHQLYSGINELG